MVLSNGRFPLLIADLAHATLPAYCSVLSLRDLLFGVKLEQDRIIEFSYHSATAVTVFCENERHSFAA